MRYLTAVLTYMLLAAMALPGCAGAANVVRLETIKSVLADYVRARINPGDPEAVKIDFPGRMNEIKLPPHIKHTGDLDFQVSGPADNYIGDLALVFKVSHQGQIIREERVPVRVEILQEVLVSDRALPKDRIITPEDVKVVRRWVSRPAVGALGSPKEAVGKRLNSGIKANTELKFNMLSAPLVVKKGKNVKILFDNGNLVITAVGLSEQDGALGELIRVKNISSNRTLFARVISDSLVQVEF